MSDNASNEAIKNKNLVLTIEELIMMLNELFLKSGEKLKIVDCLYNLELLDVNISDSIQLKLTTTLEDIDNIYSSIPANLNGEFPNKYRYFEIFENAGFFFDKFYKQIFENVLGKIEKLNYLDGNLPIVISFDTNLYLNQNFTHLSTLLQKKFGNPRFPINFLLSEGVKTELTIYEWKYKPIDIENLRDFCKNSEVIEEFYNQNKLNSRIWHMGHIDFLKCLDSTYSKIIDIDNSIENDDMDQKIIEGLNKEVKQQNIKLYLFSKDSDFIARAKGNRNIVPIFLENIPLFELKKDINCDWELFLRLLYNLAITFGAIKLIFQDNLVIVLYGIWRGKKYHHWENEMIKLKSDNLILNNIKRDLQILRNIKFREGLSFE